MSLVEIVKYAAKFLVALAVALGVLVVGLSDQVMTASEWLQVVLAFLGALGVYAVPNKPQE